MMTRLQGPQILPCYLHFSIHVDESTAENSMRFPANLHLDHPSLEQISIKRVKSVEKKCIFPSIGLIFIRGHLFEKDNNNYCDPECDENSGLFECVQMIQQEVETAKSREARLDFYKHTISTDGYLIFAYKTMEDMFTRDFASNWKTWSGARLLCQMLPEKYKVKRLSFFRKVSGRTQFFYILIAQIEDLMKDCAPALNVLNCIKPRVCAFVGAYRIVTFRVDVTLCNALNVSEDQHLYAYTTSLKVNYSNHTAFASYPEYTEFRSDDEKLPKANKEEHTEVDMSKRSEETQTELIERSTMRRTLPRTISIYDFPSMKNSMQNPHKEGDAAQEYTEPSTSQQDPVADRADMAESVLLSDKKSSPIPVALVHPLPSSPTGVWVRKSTPKHTHATFEPGSPTSSNQRKYSLQESPNVVRKITLDRIIEELLQEAVQSSREEPEKCSKKKRRALSEVRVVGDERKWDHEDDGLLRRLKLLYFNSPEYTSEELRASQSD